MASFRQDPRGTYAPNPSLAALKNLGLVGQPPFRLDEGYSEDTRSQSGASDAFRMDANMEEVMEQDIDQILPEWLVAMSEEQKSGMVHMEQCVVSSSVLTMLLFRICIPGHAIVANFVNSRHCR